MRLHSAARLIWFSRAALLGFAGQLPLLSRPPPNISSCNMSTRTEFRFKSDRDRFTPKNLIELPRPGAGTANAAGDLVLVPVSKYSFADKK